MKLSSILTWVVLLSAGHLCAQDLETVAKEKPVTLSGNLSLDLLGYKATGYSNGMKPLGYSMGGYFNAKIYGVDLPFQFFYSDQSKEFNSPFSQFGITPTYKWLKLYLGYNNINFSPTVLGGKTILGVGVEMNPGIFRFGAVYGRFKAPIQEDLQRLNNLPQYKRIGYSVKLGLGKENNFFDFVFLKAKDDSSSINTLANYKETVRPAQNTVIGTNSKFTIKKRIILSTDVSVSAYTLDLQADRLSVDSANTAPIIKMLTKLIEPRLSTGLSSAAHGNLSYVVPVFSIGVDYKRVDPNYQSMGVDYLLNDYQNVTLQSTARIWKNKFTVSLTGGKQTDNLNNFKNAKTGRNIYSASVNYFSMKKFGCNLSYSNYTLSQTSGRVNINDTLRISNVNENLLINPFWLWSSERHSHSLSLIANALVVTDNNAFTSAYTNSTISNYMANYSLYFNQLRLNFTQALGYTNLSYSAGKITTLSYSSGVSRTWLGEKLQTGLNLMISTRKGSNVSGGLGNTVNANAAYRVSEKHEFHSSISIMNNTDGGYKVGETRWNIGYQLSF